MAFNTRQIAIVAAAAVIVAAGAYYFLTRHENSAILSGATTGASTTSPASSAASSELMVAGPLGEMALGDPNAPNVIIEYASLTCSHCQAFHSSTYPELKSKYIDTGKAYFILREYPLDPLATAAVVLARCAPKEQFFPLVDLMFDRQREWAFVSDPKTALQNLVKQAGMTPDQFNACLTNQEILDGVNWVKNRGATEFHVSATPTFFVNGEELKGERDIAAFDKLLGG